MAEPHDPELRQESFLQEEPVSRGAPDGAKKRKPLTILTIVIIIGAIIGFFAWMMGRGYQSTDDAFIDGHIIQVSARISAQVVGVHIDDNQEVKKGELLVELDPRDFRVAVEKAEAQLASAQAQAAQAGAQLAQQTAQFDIANINFNRNAGLYQQDLRAVARQEVDSTKATLDAARANVDAARSAAQAADAQIKSAQAAVDDARNQLSYTDITAAESGRITRKTVEVGNYITAGQTLFSIVQHDVWVTANFKETQLARMQAGQPVRIRVDAFPGRDFKAHVESFQLGSGSRFSLLPAENATGNYVKVVQRVPVKIVFDEPEDVLDRFGPGMSVEPRVDVSAQGSTSKQ